MSTVAEALQLTLCTLSRLSVLSLHRGQLSQALRVGDQAAHFIASERDLSPLRGLTYLARGEVLCERNDLDAAQQQLTTGLELLQRSADHYMLVRGVVALARAQQAQGQDAAALATFDYAETWLAQRHIQSPLSHIYLAAHRTRLWLQQDNLDAAIRWVQAYQEATNGALESLQQLTRVRVDLAVARRAASEQALQHAAALLEQQQALTAVRAWQGDLIEILLLQALVFQAQGDQPRALAALSQALSMAEPEGYIRLFADEGVPMYTLLRATDDVLRRKIAAHPALRSYIRRKLEDTPVFEEVDVILTYSAPGTPPKGLDSTGDPRLNRLWTLLGTPCVNVPTLAAEGNLPVGVQIVAPIGKDGKALAAARFVEQALRR